MPESNKTDAPRLDLINIDEFWPNIDNVWPNIDYLCQKSSNACQKNPGTSFSQKKKAPAGMPTHRTGVDNIKNPLKSIKINQDQLKSIKNT